MRFHDLPDTETDKLRQRFKCLWWPEKTTSHLFSLFLATQRRNGRTEGEQCLKGVTAGAGRTHTHDAAALPVVPEAERWPVTPQEGPLRGCLPAAPPLPNMAPSTAGAFFWLFQEGSQEESLTQ